MQKGRQQKGHRVHAEFIRRQVIVSLVGMGGSGSMMLTELGRIHTAMRALGHPGGLMVVAYDPDRVTDANRGRQMFAASDVGHYKATVLIHRVNAFFGTNWIARPSRIQDDPVKWQITGAPAHILVTCVDSGPKRAEIATAVQSNIIRPFPRYGLDLGNGADYGQVVLGETPYFEWSPDRQAIEGSQPRTDPKPDRKADPAGWIQASAGRLPTVLDLYPELGEMEGNDTPSCSIAEALDRQDLFINRHMTTWAGTVLWKLFREGRLDYHAAWVNLSSGEVSSRPARGIELRPGEIGLRGRNPGEYGQTKIRSGSILRTSRRTDDSGVAEEIANPRRTRRRRPSVAAAVL